MDAPPTDQIHILHARSGVLQFAVSFSITMNSSVWKLLMNGNMRIYYAGEDIIGIGFIHRGFSSILPFYPGRITPPFECGLVV